MILHAYFFNFCRPNWCAMVQQPGMYYNAGAGIQHPPQQQGAYYQPQAGLVGYQPQPQTSAGYQPPPAYSQEETKSVPN